MFAVPTYAFLVSMFIMIGVGITKGIVSGFQHSPIPAGHIPIAGTKGGPVLVGATVFLVLHAFASGGAAMTGVEAISNGVPAFKKPEWKNARSTLMVMGTCLGIMFLGISLLASRCKRCRARRPR